MQVLVNHGNNIEVYGAIDHEHGVIEYYALNDQGHRFFEEYSYEDEYDEEREEELVSEWKSLIPEHIKSGYSEVFNLDSH